MSHLIDYTLHLADNALIIGHRCSEWCGHGPILEQDIALSNMALDYIGQARYLYQYAATLINQMSPAERSSFISDNGEATEDSLAYLRDEREFKNLLLTEMPNGDWAQTVLRQFFFSTYQYYLYAQLQKSSDAQLAAIAEKSLKEVTYHLKWSSEWVIRLGDGTEESKRRLLRALDELWMFTGELFEIAEYETGLLQDAIAVDLSGIQSEWEQKVAAVFEEATIEVPATKTWHQTGGKRGVHTEHLGYLLAEMQYLQRVHPGATW